MQAYETLSDPVKRRAYNDDLAHARRSAAAGGSGRANGESDDEGWVLRKAIHGSYVLHTVHVC